jgi:hypothetical protein
MGDLSKCFFRENDLVAREISGETIVVPVRSKAGDVDFIYTLDEVGTMIWVLLDGKTSVTQIVEAIVASFDVAPGEAAKDTVDFLAALEEAGLIHQ